LWNRVQSLRVKAGGVAVFLLWCVGYGGVLVVWWLGKEFSNTLPPLDFSVMDRVL
jgi:hypothetical protein